MNKISVDASAALKLHKEALVINALDATPTCLWAYDPRQNNKIMSEYIDVVQAGGVDAANYTLSFPEENFRQAISNYIRWQRLLATVGERVMVVKRAGDLLHAQRNGKVGVILGFQNAKPIEDDLELIEVFHRLDIRVIQLTYNRRNYIGDGCGERVDGGLSKFGVAAVQELNRVGMVVDLSHGGTRTALDAVEVSSAPVIISHTGARALCQHFRCIPDELIHAVASRGGCIGVGAFSLLIRDDGATAGSTLMDYVAHMEHMIEVAGIDHVGIGFDVSFKRTDADTAQIEAAYPEFKMPPLHLRYATELNRVDKTPNLTTALVERGYREEDIRKLLGLNWYRVFAQVWGE